MGAGLKQKQALYNSYVYTVKVENNLSTEILLIKHKC